MKIVSMQTRAKGKIKPFQFIRDMLHKVDLWHGRKWHRVVYSSSRRDKNKAIGYFLLLGSMIWLNSYQKYEFAKMFRGTFLGPFFYWNQRFYFTDWIALILLFMLIRKVWINFVGYRFSFIKLPTVFYGTKLKNRLLHVIRSNHLYNSQMIDGEEQVSNSVKIDYSYNDKELLLRVWSSGANYTLKSQDMAIILSSAVGITCDNVDNGDPSYTLYRFRRVAVERLYIDNNTIYERYGEQSEILLNSEVIWDVKRAPHALIAGGTGGGKSTFVQYIMLEFLKKGAEVYLLDPKRSDLFSFKQFFPDGRVGSTPGQIAKIMREVNERMNKRYEENNSIFQGNYLDYGLRPIVVFFDEMAAFMVEDKKIATEVQNYMKQIVMKGRQMGVFMILSTQKPDSDAIPTAVRDQLGLRVVVGQMQNSGLRMALGDFDEDLPSVEMGIGRGLYYVDGLGWTAPRPYTAPYLNSKEVDFLGALKTAVEYAENIDFKQG